MQKCHYHENQSRTNVATLFWQAMENVFAHNTLVLLAQPVIVVIKVYRHLLDLGPPETNLGGSAKTETDANIINNK